jgi:hypothetical protein
MENKETLEEVAKRLYEYQSQNPPYTIITPKAKIEGFIEGAKWQVETMYSEEEVEHLIHLAVFQSHCGVKDRVKIPNSNECAGFVNKWFEQHKKK